MIIIELFFTVIILFPLLVMILGIMVWLKLRFRFHPSSIAPEYSQQTFKDGNVIEGHYTVLSETDKK